MKRLSKFKYFVLAIFMVVFSFVIFSKPANAATFDPGRIIDDGIFTNKSAMSVSDIQNFLNSKVPVCDTWHAPGPSAQGANPPWYCLKEYIENGKSSSQIIWEAAQNYSINPQVLLVTLQKENGLVTDTWPYPWQYRTAMGFACPDNGTCDPAFYGFTNQVNQAARHFRNFYDQNPSWYIPYRPGINYIQYNPNAGCGGTNVNIQNRATAALYSYTPYQPNSAALSNLYGTGDGCSAYGNRNFWRDFNNWFGSTVDAPYQWQVYSQSWSKDISNLPRGEKATLTLKALNTGTQTWLNSGNNPVRLGTFNPTDRGSGFYTSSWPATTRPALMQEASVAPGQVGTFSFEIQANVNPGSYNEYFNLVADGITWFNNTGQFFPINVVNPVISAQLVDNIYPGTVTTGTTFTATIRLKNTGNIAWNNTGSYPADIYTSPYNRQSVFISNSWPNPVVPARLVESSVAPGSIGTFNFNLNAPQSSSNFQEQYTMGITGLGWSGLVINQNVAVINSSQQVKTPVYRHYNPSRGVHFYTSDINESNRIRSQGWNYEGIAWNVSSTVNNKPVYRHYNPSLGRHFYTTDLNESNRIRSQGWNYEGIAWYGSDVNSQTPVYRHYNSSRRAHFYTSDLNESNNIRSQGWSYEGVAYYAID